MKPDRRPSITARPEPTVLWVCVAVLLAVNAVVYALKFETALGHSFAVNPVESAVVFLSTHWGAMFQPIDQVPTYLTLYPPVYPAVVSGVNAVVADPFLAGRLVTVAATVVATVLVAHCARRRTADRRIAGGAAAAAFLFSPYVAAKYGFYAGPNVLALAASLGAVAWFAGRRNGGLRRDAGCVCLCLVALFTKQSMVAAPAAIALTLALDRNWRGAVRFAVGLSASGLSLLGLLAVATDGRAWSHLVTYNRDHPFSLTRALVRTGRFLGVEGALLLCAVVGAVGLYRHTSSGVDPTRIEYVYAFIGLVSGAFFLTKAGSDANHLLPFLAGLAIVVGQISGRLGELRTGSADSAGDWTGYSSAVLALFAAYLLVAATASVAFAAPLAAPAGSAQAAAAIDCPAGVVLTDDPDVALAAPNATPAWNDHFTLTLLADSDRWNGSVVTTAIRDRNFSYVVFRRPVAEVDPSSSLWTERQVEAVRRAYALSTRAGEYWIYAPVGTETADERCGGLTADSAAAPKRVVREEPRRAGREPHLRGRLLVGLPNDAHVHLDSEAG